MGILASQYFDARRGAQPRGTDDRNAAQDGIRPRRLSWWLAGLLAFGTIGPVQAETFRIATFAAPLSRDGPGLLLRDIQKGDDPQIDATLSVIAAVDPDILVLTDFDYDLDGLALAAFTQALGDPFRYRFALQPNAGLATGMDMDGNGRLGDARDGHGYGRFAGDGGMAVLSRYPIEVANVTDLSALLWKDIPGAILPQDAGGPFPSAQVQDRIRLSSTGHWIVPILVPGGAPLSVLASSATPPVFDGPEDMNGLRNRDELRLWEHVIEGEIGTAPDSFVLAANTNLDPNDGDGLRAAMMDFLQNPRVQDPLPNQNTADWPEEGAGNLRVSYVLPSRDWTVSGAGIFWPAPGDQDFALLGDDGLAAGPHHLVWVDLRR